MVIGRSLGQIDPEIEAGGPVSIMASMASTEQTRSMLRALTSATNSPQAVPVKASPIRAMTWADLLRVERACHGTLRLMII